MTPTSMARTLNAERLEAEEVVAEGTIKSVDLESGLGFIDPDEGDSGLRFHVPNVLDGPATLTPGTRVRFVVDEGSHGLEAFSIVRLEAGE